MPGDHVVVAVEDCLRGQRGEIGACVGLAEPLTPSLAATYDPWQEPPSHIVVPMSHDALDEIAEAWSWRCSGGGELLVDDDLVDARQSVSANVRRPRQPEETCVIERSVPRRLSRPVGVGRR